MNKMLRSSVIATAMMLSLAAQSSAMESGNTQTTNQFKDQSMLQKTQPVRQLTVEQQAKKEAMFKNVMKILERTNHTEQQLDEVIKNHQKTYFNLVSEESKAEYGLLVTGIRAEIKEKNIQRLSKEIEQERPRLDQQQKLMEEKTTTEQHRKELNKKFAAFNQKADQLQSEQKELDLIREQQKQMLENREKNISDLTSKFEIERDVCKKLQAENQALNQFVQKIPLQSKDFERLIEEQHNEFQNQLRDKDQQIQQMQAFQFQLQMQNQEQQQQLNQMNMLIKKQGTKLDEFIKYIMDTTE